MSSKTFFQRINNVLPCCEFCGKRLLSYPVGSSLISERYYRRAVTPNEVEFPGLPSRLKGQKVRKLKFPPLPSVQDLLRIYQLKSVRQLSQTFLIKQSVAKHIALGLGPLTGSTVYEVGERQLQLALLLMVKSMILLC